MRLRLRIGSAQGYFTTNERKLGMGGNERKACLR